MPPLLRHLHPVMPVALDEHRRSGRHAVVEVEDVLIEHADAAARDLLADAPGLVRAVDAEEDVAVALVEVEGTGAERVVEAGLAEARQVGLQLHHGGGRAPVRPDAFAAHIGDAAPGEALTPDAD